MAMGGDVECRAGEVARAFFEAATKLSEDNEDILPQEDAPDLKLSVFYLFSELFPEFVCDKERDGPGKGGLMRLQFNKIGYEIYDKEQSRRVPAVRAKPGNPGYGFRRARWRNSMEGEDRKVCENVLKGLGVTSERIERVKSRVNDMRLQWEAVRRPSRPAGPGRPRGHKRPNVEPAAALIVGDKGVWGPAEGGGAAPPEKGSEAESTKKSKKKGSMTKQTASSASANYAGPKEDSPVVATVTESIVVGTDTEDDMTDGMQEPVLWTSTPEGGSSVDHADSPEDEAHQTASLSEENQSLRSLNMSLIFEREQLMREVAEEEANVKQLKTSVESLLGQIKASAAPEAQVISKAVSWLSDHCCATEDAKDAKPKGIAGESEESVKKYNETLSSMLDQYDEWEKRGPNRSTSSLLLRREITRALNPSASLPPLPVSERHAALRDSALKNEHDAGLIEMTDPDPSYDFLFHHAAA